MRAIGCLLTLLVVLAIGLFLYRGALTEGPRVVSPERRIDTVRFRTELLSIAQAERLYVVTHGRYATLDELFEAHAIPFSGGRRHGYDYSAEIDGDRHFVVTATPVDPAKAGWPTFRVDETMQVTTEESE